MQDLVSVIIPSYKGAGKLKRAINSLSDQTYQNIEIIVVDDNNPDTAERIQTERVIDSLQLPNLKYIRHPENMNGSAARNTGIRAAKGKYIAFLDDDDVYLPYRVEKSVAALKKQPESKAVFCDVIHVFGNGQCSIYSMTPENISVKGILMYEAAIGSGSNLFIEAKTIQTLEGFDISFVRHQDLEFTLRLVNICKPSIINEVLVVKSSNGINNEPDYYRMCDVKQKYNEKFAGQISRLSEAEQKKYFLNCYTRLYYLALNSGKVGEAECCLKKMEQYGFTVGKKQKLQMVLAGIHILPLLRKLQYARSSALKSQSRIIWLKDVNGRLKADLEKTGILCGRDRAGESR